MNMKKFMTMSLVIVVLSTASYAMAGGFPSEVMGVVKEIVGLKCPNHDYVKDSHNFMYESVGGNSSTSGTRCLRCGYTKSLHKPQK